MAEYIEREALIKALEADFSTDWADYASKNNFNKDYIDGVRDEYDDVLRIICQQSAADVQPVKQGHWYHNTSKYVSELDAYFIQACCSCCGRYSDKIDQYSQIMSNETCSHCGAEMRGEENG